MAAIGALLTQQPPVSSVDMGAAEYQVGGSSSAGTSLPARLAASTGTEYYVNYATGNDTTGTGAIGAPWKSIAQAMATVPNHSIVNLRGGNYPERVDPLAAWSGTAGGVKTLRSYPSETAVLQRYIRCDEGQPFQYWRFYGLDFYGTLTQVGEDTSFYGRANTANLEFYNCNIHHQPLGSGMVFDTGSSNIQWHGCLVYQNGRASTILDHGLYISGVGHVIANCVIYKNSAYGIQMYRAADGCYVVNNTIIENGIRTSDPVWSGGMVLEAIAQDGTNNNLIMNNIMGWNDGAGIRTGGSLVGLNNQLRNNCCSQNVLADIYDNNAAFIKSGNISSDPILVDRAAENYRIQATSPCRDAGLVAYAPSSDILGVAR